MRFKVLSIIFVACAVVSCRQKSDVTDICDDMIKESLHKSARSLTQYDEKGQKLTISEYEFLGGVTDNRLVYRTIAFGDGVYQAKSVDTLSYEYGEWAENNTRYSIYVTPRTEAPYVLWYAGNSFTTPDGRVIGGDGVNCTARVEKWEETLASISNTEWEAYYEGDFVMDSIFKDSIKTIFIPPITVIYDTIRVFSGEMDTLNADTTCRFRFSLKRDPETLANTGHFYKKSVRSKYNRDDSTVVIISEEKKEYDCSWHFSNVSSGAKFVIELVSTESGVTGDQLSISKYTTDKTTGEISFLLGGLTYKTVAAQP